MVVYQRGRSHRIVTMVIVTGSENTTAVWALIFTATALW